MESVLCVNIPAQMISSFDTNGKLHPCGFIFGIEMVSLLQSIYLIPELLELVDASSDCKPL